MGSRSARGGGNPDSTQAPIVAALRKVGASVKIISIVGRGWDLLVGFRGRDFKLEVKGPKTPVTDEQLELHRTWRGAPTYVVRTPLEALQAIGAVRRAA
jgi:hypothetical protein